jgi:hypothetical protein
MVQLYQLKERTIGKCREVPALVCWYTGNPGMPC